MITQYNFLKSDFSTKYTIYQLFQPTIMPPNLTQSSSISTNSSPLDGTLFPPLFKAVGEFWDQNMTIELKNNLVIGMNLLVIGIVIYLIFQLVHNYIQKNKPRFALKIKTQPNFFIKDNLGNEMFVLASKLHKLAKGSVITFEIHKNGNDQYFLFTAINKGILVHIQTELKKIPGLGVEECSTALGIFKTYLKDSKPYQLQLSASSKFGLFKKAEYRIVGNVCSFLSSLPADQNGSIVIAFRPNYKTYQIKSQIAKLNFKIRKDSKEYGTDLNIIEEIKDLNDKKISEIFTVKITTIGSTSSIVDQLATCFGLINSNNKFIEKISNANSKSIRYVTNSPVIPQRISYLNCSELSSVVHFADFKNAETFNSKIVEESIEIKKIKESSKIHAEKSTDDFNLFSE